jgi:hypothetical protein
VKRVNWELITQNGYTFEFENKAIRSITLTITASSEKVAWEKLESLY